MDGLIVLGIIENVEVWDYFCECVCYGDVLVCWGLLYDDMDWVCSDNWDGVWCVI